MTDRDRVVAELGPPRETRSPVLAGAFLADLVRKGWMTPPSAPVMPLAEILEGLDADRSER